MNVLADLRARADGRPGIDHGAAVDIGADIHKGRHQHDVGRQKRALARGRRRHDAEARGAKAVFTPALELGGHLVPEHALARPIGDDHVVGQAEGQQHRLLEPLMHDPRVALLLRDPHRAGI